MNAKEAKLKADTYDKRQIEKYIKEIEDAIETVATQGQYRISITYSIQFTKDVAEHFKGKGFAVVPPEEKIFPPKVENEKPHIYYNTGSISWEKN